MKFSKNAFDTVKKAVLGAALFISAFCILPSAFGQVGIDVYTPIRSIVWTSPTLVSQAAVSTNGPFDLFGYTGRSFVDISSGTNSAPGGTSTATIQSSPDTTNWTTLTNFALINSTTQYIYTNMYYNSTNTLVVSNNYLLPGAITFGTAGNSSNAFFGPYVFPSGAQLFTNGNAVTITAKGWYRVAWDPRSQPNGARYYQIYYTQSTATNLVSAVFNGIRSSEVQ